MKSTCLTRRSPDFARSWFGLLAFAATLSAAVLLSAGCGSKQAPGPPEAVAVLADTSASAGSPQVVGTYRRAMRAVLANAPAGTVLTWSPVTENSIATGYAGGTVDLPAYDPLVVNQDEYATERRRAAEQALAGFRKTLGARDRGDGTDLFYSLAQAGTFFNGDRCRGANDKSLIVESDGLQQTGFCDFTAVDLTDTEDAAIIRRLRLQGALPDLRGVRVWFVGLGADPSGQVPAAKILQVKRFWLSYFRACHADVSPERFGPSLENYD